MAWVRETWGVTLTLCCLVGIASAGGCSGGVDTEPSDAAAGSSGSAGSGGSSGTAGRGGSGGSAGSAGTATGGTSGSGGGEPDSCMPVMDEGVCIACARRNCCFELLACGKDQPCMKGTVGTDSELGCIMRCVTSAVSDGGVANDETFTQCAGACAVGSTISPATNELFTCLISGERGDGAIGADCVVDCFSGD